MIKLLHRQRGFVFAILLLSLSATTVLWSTNIMTNVSLVESTAWAAATNPDNDIRGTIPENLYHQQQTPIRSNKNNNKKRPWNQPDLTFTLKRNAVEGSSSRGSNRPERSKYPRTQKKLHQEVEDQKEENQNDDDKGGKEGEDQNEDDDEEDDAKEETQTRIKTKRTRAKKKARTKKNKRRTVRKKREK
jgi:hypothetical protein